MCVLPVGKFGSTEIKYELVIRHSREKMEETRFSLFMLHYTVYASDLIIELPLLPWLSFLTLSVILKDKISVLKCSQHSSCYFLIFFLFFL